MAEYSKEEILSKIHKLEVLIKQDIREKKDILDRIRSRRSQVAHWKEIMETDQQKLL